MNNHDGIIHHTDEEEDQHMEDLALNSHFDSALFDYWEEDPATLQRSDDDDCREEEAITLANTGGCVQHTEPVHDGSQQKPQQHLGGETAAIASGHSWKNSITMEECGQLTTFQMNGESSQESYSKNGNSFDAQTRAAASAANADAAPAYVGACQQTNFSASQQKHQQHQHALAAAAAAAAMTGNFSFPLNTLTQLHPLAIQSFANCPPHALQQHMMGALNTSTSNGPATNTANTQQQQQPQQLQQQQQQQQVPSINDLSAAGLLPLTISALAAGVPYPFPIMTQQQLQQQMQTSQQQQQHNTNYQQNNSMPMQGSSFSHEQGHHQTSSVTVTDNFNSQELSSCNNTISNPANTNTSMNTVGNSFNQQSPFLLFDAPMELRTNFENSQRAHGLSGLQDYNAVHFGFPVNGFHPQGLQVQLPFQSTLSSTQHASFSSPAAAVEATTNELSGPDVKVIDARHGDIGGKKIKNAKEQRRAQRIADLIDELREKMEQGGWDVGLRSKYNTLSSCADYIQHLVKVNREKETDIEKAKMDLKAKQAILEADKAEQDPSDPESMNSSQPMSSLSASSRQEGEDTSDSSPYQNANLNKETTVPNNKRSTPLSFCANNADEESNKKARTVNKDSTCTTVLTDSLSEKDYCSTSKDTTTKSCFNQGTSSISDITDSNKSLSSNSLSDTGPTGAKSVCHTESKTEEDSGDANIDNGRYCLGKEEAGANARLLQKKYAAVVEKKKSQSDESTSMDADFVLDYEEVFLKSNVPQILASTAGRIIAWNEFFLKVTGLSETEVEQTSIFSLVKVSKLSKLFEIVAAALKNGCRGDVSSTASCTSDAKENSCQTGASFDSKPGTSASHSSTLSPPLLKQLLHDGDYTAMTLPCVKFRAKGPSPLYITVTLMPDEDPKKRCFHCVLTDSPGTREALGPITPELLTTLFATSNVATIKEKFLSVAKMAKTSAKEEKTRIKQA